MDLTVSNIALKLNNVTKAFGKSPAVCQLNIDVKLGEFLVLLGPSGCGKTTTLRLMAGFESPEEGEISIDSEVVSGFGIFMPPEKRHIGMVFQDYALFPHLRVAANIAFGLPSKKNNKHAIVSDLLQLVGLDGMGDRYPHELSGGEQQRVALARTLAPNPKVVLLDEPFSNLDADLRREMRLQVKEILQKYGTTVVLVTHDQDEAFELGDRVAILNKGILEQIGTPEEIFLAPASRFVGEFIGRADFLDGTWSEIGLETEVGTLHQKADVLTEHCGKMCEVLVRPEIVNIEHDEKGHAVVVEERYSGMNKLFCLELPSGRRIHSLQPPTAAFEKGNRVRVKVDASHCVCFAKE